MTMKPTVKKKVKVFSSKAEADKVFDLMFEPGGTAKVVKVKRGWAIQYCAGFLVKTGDASDLPAEYNR